MKYLSVSSPEKEIGKKRRMEIIILVTITTIIILGQHREREPST
jgi:hypothetical protein